MQEVLPRGPPSPVAPIPSLEQLLVDTTPTPPTTPPPHPTFGDHDDGSTDADVDAGGGAGDSGASDERASKTVALQRIKNMALVLREREGQSEHDSQDNASAKTLSRSSRSKNNNNNDEQRHNGGVSKRVLSAEELHEKRLKRLVQNRQSAALSRERKRQYILALEQELDNLKQELYRCCDGEMLEYLKGRGVILSACDNSNRSNSSNSSNSSNNAL